MEIITVKVGWCADESTCGKGNFSAYSDQIPGCFVTFAGNFADFEAYWQESVNYHVECLDVNELPDCLKVPHTFRYEMTVQALLHYYDGILTRAAISRATGINQNQLSHYMNGVRNPRPDKRRLIINGLHKIGHELLTVE